ncbi:MAG: DUF2147 domain-containing protein [Betaproteobacteria bacterium]|nr:DUF2147 domain-containing protein [Betaproteobacteria bacterium]MDE2132746.1 DUF2147 domain-containing protein [Betaproteobacteria bacterium]MDE2212212.1 DUF2147 domain-containing protein [Betaproteobacteria bacterium]MDE2625014.1 DUF2147 domain-containing protein [Betaproteobacteria bacterium]
MKRTAPFVIALLLGLSALAAQAIELSPVGLWRTFDDEDGQAASLVRIDNLGGVLEGRVVRILPRPGHPLDARCDECSGARKGQPVTGMVILWGMKQDGGEYDGGQILDPHNGRTYRCKMKVKGNTLEVRGYLGFSLFGRSQTWVREP